MFNYKNELYDQSEGKLNSSSFTPEGVSRRAFVPADIDISLEMQQDCKKLLNDITKRHQLSHPEGLCNNEHQHSHHISKSNPPVINRRLVSGAATNQSAQGGNSFSFDISSINASVPHVRDSSQKNDRRKGVARPLLNAVTSERPNQASSTKKSPPSRLEEDLKQRNKQNRRDHQQKNRTLYP